ncbi:carboxylesterase family protein [Actinomyces urogenitalis]|uniref:carboxylesterase family protein n=2 Tax=Actinomyces urogenitalis TaxID=103621 RepID=UPI0028FF055C|nr:carboxylesterase family protein [Actinomyces urogenitalis]MDU0864122.1 carboxylesterase family protein [Actinomyces urogenitalis]MDU1564146.1 carboxylesterase family protein [Actinomyces urogenitalis]
MPEPEMSQPRLPLSSTIQASTGPVRRWAGIPYASAERFEPARAVDVLPGQALTAGPAPAQPLPYYEDPGAPVSEDCLNLTVWAPQEAGEEPLPVVVWIYGGGFEHGANSSAFSDASALAGTGGVIAVAPNYRTGVLGFLSLSHLGGYNGVSNLGLRDAVLALRWIRRHIAAFGGDPSRVTVVGESAGAFIAGALPAIDEAAGLYRGLVLASGGMSRVVPGWRAKEMTAAFLRELGVEHDPQALRRADLADLFAAQPTIAVSDIGQRNSTAPQALGIVDDSAEPTGVLAMHPMRALEAGRAALTPILVCSTRDEISAFRNPEVFDPVDLDAVRSEIEDLGVERTQAEALVTHYASLPEAPTGEAGSTPGLVRQRMLTDWIYRLPAARAALAQAAAGGTAYLAMTGRADGAQAGHACDGPALLGSSWPQSTPAMKARDAQVRGWVLDMATDGEPGWPALPAGQAPAPERVEELRLGQGAVVAVAGEDFDAAGDYRMMTELWHGVGRP